MKKEEEEERFKHVAIKLSVNFDNCTNEIEFISEKDMVIDGIETFNIHSFKVFINGEEISLDEEINVLEEDTINVKVERENLYKGGNVTFKGYDPNNTFDSEDIPQTPFDEEVREEIIEIDKE